MMAVCRAFSFRGGLLRTLSTSPPKCWEKMVESKRRLVSAWGGGEGAAKRRDHAKWRLGALRSSHFLLNRDTPSPPPPEWLSSSGENAFQ